LHNENTRTPVTTSDKADGQPQACQKPWSLTKTLIIVIGGCCVVHLSIFFTLTTTLTHDTAVHRYEGVSGRNTEYGKAKEQWTTSSQQQKG
jgi:hypothetical protein